MKRLPRIFSVISSLLLVFNNVTPLSYMMSAVNFTYHVDRLTDNNVAGGGDGSGVTGDLRYAITHAKSGESIRFKVTGTIYLAATLPTLTHNITIEGPGADQLIVDGVGGSVLSISSDTSIVISSLSLTGGFGNGGGIFNAGILTLIDCTISGNTAGDPTNGGGTGAGIWNYTTGTLTLNNSTVSGNSVYGNSFYNPSRGGGIANYGTLTINNSTVSGNSAFEGRGGGISNVLPTSVLLLRNSTVNDNSATGVIGISGGIDNHGTLQAVNTIIAGNSGSQVPDLFGVLNSWGHNLIGNTDGGSGFRSDLGDILNVNPMLSNLKNNGGSTETTALLVGSPAVDAGNDTVCAAAPINNLDQRGVTRPQGAHCDIGSFEGTVSSVNTVTPTPSATATSTVMATNTPTNTLTDTPTNTATSTPTDTLTVTSTNTPINIPINTPTNTPTFTPTDTATSTPSNTPTEIPTSTPINTPTPTPFSNTTGRVTGGGTILDTKGIRASVGFTVRYDAGDLLPKGDVVYQDHKNNLRLKAMTFESLVIEDHHVWITGTGIINGQQVVSFRIDVYVFDKTGSADVFYISIPSMNGYRVGGSLAGGSIAIHEY